MTNLTDYQQFRQQWLAMHPASVPELEEDEIGEYESWVRWAVLIVFIGATLLSGVHTVPIVYRGIPTGFVVEIFRGLAAHMAMVTLEFGILLSAFVLVKGHRIIGYSVFVISFFGTFVANIVSVIETFQTESQILSLLVTLTIGGIAPVMTLMAGKLLVDIHTSRRRSNWRARKAYQEAKKELDALVLADWEISRAQQALSVQTADSRQPSGASATGFGYDRRSDAQARVRAYFTDNPADIHSDRSLRDLANEIGVGKDSVASVRNAIRNGHTHE